MKKFNTDNESDLLTSEKKTESLFELYEARKRLEKERNLLKSEFIEGAKEETNLVREKKLSDTNSPLIADVIPQDDLLIFELGDDQSVAKTDWEVLPVRVKEVFEEIIYSLPIANSADSNADGCYTYSYSDDEYNLSIISVILGRKTALFYKNAG